MKKAALFVSGLLLTALASAPAVAEVVRVKITARVSFISDLNNAFNGKIVAGTRLSGTYVYNTNTPNESMSPDIGFYRPYANEARVRFAAAGFVFESEPATQNIAIDVIANSTGVGELAMTSRGNKPLPSGRYVNEIRVRFQGLGAATQTTALPSVAPSLLEYGLSDVSISSSPWGDGFQLRAEIEAAELIAADALAISPAAGSFIPSQQFDAALTLPRNSNVVNVIAKANGAPLPIGYPGYCTLVPPPTSAGQPAVLCPNANVVLPQAAGAPIEWTVELSNGSILTETSNWTLQQ